MKKFVSAIVAFKNKHFASASAFDNGGYIESYTPNFSYRNY